MYWDWSTAGQDIEEDPHSYLKIKGSFVYEAGFVPEYYWYKGVKDRYIFGDLIDPSEITQINTLDGDIKDPEAKIWPFKVHRGKQPYDTVYNYLLQPQTAGEGGYWDEFDWDQALRLGSAAANMALQRPIWLRRDRNVLVPLPYDRPLRKCPAVQSLPHPGRAFRLAGIGLPGRPHGLGQSLAEHNQVMSMRKAFQTLRASLLLKQSILRFLILSLIIILLGPVFGQPAGLLPR
jgi:hypothetical protein